VLSPDDLRANEAGEGGLVDLTRMSNQPPFALLASASPLGDAGGTNSIGTANRPASGVGGPAGSALSEMPSVRLEGLRGASQAFDVAVSPTDSSDNANTLGDASAEMRFHPTTAWPTPMLPRMNSDSAIQTPPAAVDAAPPPSDGKTTFVPAHLPADVAAGSSPASANVILASVSLQSSAVADADAKNSSGKPHDRIATRLADFVHDLSVAARLNDRRIDAAIVVAALAAVPFRRFRKQQDLEI
jgi:hypothetical protein